MTVHVPPPLDVLIVEDEALVAEELSFAVSDAGYRNAGRAMSSVEAISLARALAPSLALVDVQLADGASGVDAARAIARDSGAAVLFMTADVLRLPGDLAGACGVIGKPYSEQVVSRALAYVGHCLREARAPGPPPLGLTLSADFTVRWGADLAKVA